MVKTTRNKAKHLTIVFLGTFILATTFGFGSEAFVGKVQSLVLALLFLLFVIFIGVIFDIVGVAVTAANEVPFHAKGANRVKGSAHAVKLIRNADLVANICADVIGDVTGTISGALAAGIALDIIRIFPGLQLYQILLTTLMLGLAASLTVTSKAWGKSIGINKANDVIFQVGKILAWIESATGLQILKTGKQRKRGKKS